MGRVQSEDNDSDGIDEDPETGRTHKKHGNKYDTEKNNNGAAASGGEKPDEIEIRNWGCKISNNCLTVLLGLFIMVFNPIIICVVVHYIVKPVDEYGKDFSFFRYGLWTRLGGSKVKKGGH